MLLRLVVNAPVNNHEKFAVFFWFCFLSACLSCCLFDCLFIHFGIFPLDFFLSHYLFTYLFSPDGTELLVSYCADYVYLFTLRGTKQPRSFQDIDSENGYSNGSNGHRNVPPLKRLRLRGDWSDTGPNARPESEHPSPESSLMQRMSDMFARWLEESFRAGQRQRARTSSSRSASVSSTTSSSSVSSSPTYFSSSSSESSGASGVFVEQPRRRRNHEQNSEAPRSRRGLRFSSCADDIPTEMDSESVPNQDAEVKPPEGGNVSSTTSVELIPHSEEGNVSRTSSAENTTDENCSSSVTITSTGSDTVSREHSVEDATSTRLLTCEYENTTDGDTMSRSNTDVTTKRERPDKQSDSSDTSPSISIHNRRQKRTKNARKAESFDHLASASGSYSDELPRGEINYSPEARQESPCVTSTRAEPTPCDEPGSSRNAGESAETDAATRIQRVYRLHKKTKTSTQVDEQDIWIPEMTRVYKGHRNARTMVS